MINAMRHFGTILFALLFIGCSFDAISGNYKLSGKSYEMTWPAGAWNGKISFGKSYCATAPQPDKAARFTQAMFNNNGIYLGKIEYPDNIILSIVLSRIPPGRTTDDDIAKLLAQNQEQQKRAAARELVYEVSEISTDFGKTMTTKIRNIISDTPETGPFPLGFQITSTQDNKFQSLSVSRVFARGGDRFEIAAMQLAPSLITDKTEDETYLKLSNLVDSATQSLQQCTALILH